MTENPLSMELKICLCVMCGIPGSGKSSFCERLAQKIDCCFSIININYDKILLSPNQATIKFHESLSKSDNRTHTGGDSLVKSGRQQVLKLVGVIIQNLKKSGRLIHIDSFDGVDSINKDVWSNFLTSSQKSFLSSPEDHNEVLIFIDDNMHLSSMRYDFYKLARQYGAGFCEVFIESSVKNAIERNRLRQGQEFVDPEIIEKMAEKLEPPDPLKNHWEKYHIKTEENIENVFLMIQEVFENPVQPLPQIDEEEQSQSQAACSKSLIHQADLILRKCVTKTISNGKLVSVDIRLLSKQAMAAKEDILSALKSRVVSIHLQEPFNVEDASKNENSILYKYIFGLFNEKLKS